MRTHGTATLFVFLALATGATSQEPTALVLEGSAIGGIGSVTSVANFAVNDAGTWFVEADTDNADTDADSILLSAGGVFLREGDVLPLPVGATLDSFDSVTLNLAGTGGFNFFLDGTTGTTDDSGIYAGTTLLIQESDTSGAPEFSAGTPYRGFFDVKINDNAQLFVLGTADDPALTSSVDQFIAILDITAGVLVSTSVPYKEGDVLAGQTEAIATFATGPNQSAFNGSGSVLYFADLTGDTATDGVVYMDGTLLAQEGSPSPVAGRNWLSLASPELDLSNAGDVVYSGSLDGDSTTNLLVVRNGAKFVQEGDSLAAIAPFQFTSFGTGPLQISSGGKVLWYGDWDDPNTDVDTGLFLDDQLIVQEGVTTVGGVVIDNLRGITDGYTMSDNGRFVVFEAELTGGLEGAFLLDLALGTNYCLAVANSTGASAVISGAGSTSVAANAFRLLATPVPVQPGLFYYGPMQTQVPFGNGFRCVDGTFYRLDVENASASGVLEHLVDFTNPPAASGQIVAGATWNFQAWYRDPVAGGAFYNLSDGLSVTFTP